jgi:hypothetical protein
VLITLRIKQTTTHIGFIASPSDDGLRLGGLSDPIPAKISAQNSFLGTAVFRELLRSGIHQRTKLQI